MIVELATIPRLSPQSWRQECLQGRLAALTLWQGELLAVLCRPEGLAVRATRVENDEFPSLTPDLPAAQALERALFEQHGVRPLGHPWLKPLRKLPDEDRFFRVRGPQVHEVAVGPVHAGVIEPGHFRFQCNGEHVLHLEIALGYQHRGVERALVGGPSLRSIHYAETAAGDSSIAHATCYSQLCEELAGYLIHWDAFNEGCIDAVEERIQLVFKPDDRTHWVTRFQKPTNHQRTFGNNKAFATG